jgi:predicted RNA polymerase sigma factor
VHHERRTAVVRHPTIARVLLVPVATVQQRIVRAKRTLAAARVGP